VDHVIPLQTGSTLTQDGGKKMPHSRTGTATTGLLTATFHNLESAERAYQYLLDRGYSSDDITVMMSDETRAKHFPAGERVTTELGNKAAAGGLTGAAIGGTAGAIAGALAAAATIAIPGIGFVIAGPIAAALAGLGVGGAAGGILGALVGAGIPEERARTYEADIKAGNIVLVVTPRNELDAEIIERDWAPLAVTILH
jgi:hypothetical protein